MRNFTFGYARVSTDAQCLDRQIDALNNYGVDKIYASSSNRAMQTSQPTCEILKKDKEILDFCNEDNAWADFALELPDGRKTWSFYHPDVRRLFVDPSVTALGLKWYEHPELKKYNFKKGLDRIQKELIAFFQALSRLLMLHIPDRFLKFQFDFLVWYMHCFCL